MSLKKNSIYAVMALGGGFLGGMVATQLAPGAASAARTIHTLRAEKFELVDNNGARRAALEVTDTGIADLVMFDGAGQDDAELRVTRDGITTLGFYDKQGNRRVLIGEVPGGRNGMTVYGNNDKLLAGLTVSHTDEPSLTLYDPNTGRARAGLGVAGSGSTALALFDAKGNDRAELHVTTQGNPGLALANEKGKTVAGLPAHAAPSQSSESTQQ